jgi:hypothetical protein
VSIADLGGQRCSQCTIRECMPVVGWAGGVGWYYRSFAAFAVLTQSWHCARLATACYGRQQCKALTSCKLLLCPLLLWLQIDLRFASPAQGNLEVVVAPVLRFADVGYNAGQCSQAVALEHMCMYASDLRMSCCSC